MRIAPGLDSRNLSGTLLIQCPAYENKVHVALVELVQCPVIIGFSAALVVLQQGSGACAVEHA